MLMRIVSLLPSATEIVCFLGLQNQLVGISHECDFPPSVKQHPVVTRSLIPQDLSSREIDHLVSESSQQSKSLFALDCERLTELAPDLIVTQRLCDVCAVSDREVARAIASMPNRPRILELEPHDLMSALAGIKLVAQAAGQPELGETKYEELQERLKMVGSKGRGKARPSVVLLEWLVPLFSAGHWNPEIIEIAGGREMIGVAKEKSRRIEWNELRAADPEFLLIACCGYTPERAQADWETLRREPGFENLRCAKTNSIRIFDGSAYFNRPGPRLVDAVEMIAKTIA
jgi:iron complex transport system substrate-binding protein